MSCLTQTKELLSLYESACKRQRESAVRNAELLKDVQEKKQLLKKTSQQNQLNVLKASYLQYVESVYPQWLAQFKAHQETQSVSVTRQFPATTSRAPDTPERAKSPNTTAHSDADVKQPPPSSLPPSQDDPVVMVVTSFSDPPIPAKPELNNQAQAHSREIPVLGQRQRDSLKNEKSIDLSLVSSFSLTESSVKSEIEEDSFESTTQNDASFSPTHDQHLPVSPPVLHSRQDSDSSDNYTPDRVRVVSTLLKTLNKSLKTEGASLAASMYAEPEVSDNMKGEISHSSILESHIIKSADTGLDCSSWEGSVLAVVLLQQLSMLTACQGSPIPDELVKEDVPLINQPIVVLSYWSSIWELLMEHIQLLSNLGQPLDELAAIFTPALVTSSIEKACLQLLTHFKLVIQPPTQPVVLDSYENSSEVQHQAKANAVTTKTSSIVSSVNTVTQSSQAIEQAPPLSKEPLSSKRLEADTQDLSTQSNVSVENEIEHVSQSDEELDYVALGGEGSQHSLLSEGSAVLKLERELQTPQLGLYSSGDSSPEPSPSGYVPTAIESAPVGPSQLSNNSSMRRRLGFYDDSDSDMGSDKDLLSPANTHQEQDDFDFYA